MAAANGTKNGNAPNLARAACSPRAAEYGNVNYSCIRQELREIALAMYVLGRRSRGPKKIKRFFLPSTQTPLCASQEAKLEYEETS